MIPDAADARDSLTRMRQTETISGSYGKHLSRILEVRAEFLDLEARVLRPASDQVLDSEEGVVRLLGDPVGSGELRAAQFRAIAGADFLYLVNPGGYVGPAATLEAGYAYRGHTPIFAAEIPFESDLREIVTAVGDPRKALDVMTKKVAALG